jgi:hypothetical protein
MYIPIKNQEDHKALVTRYLAKKDQLKHQLEADRIGEFNLQIDAAKLFKPVTSAVQTAGADQLTKLQALQDSSNTNQQRLLQALTNQTSALQSLQGPNPFGEYPMIDSPEVATVAAPQPPTAAAPQPPTRTIDFNSDLDLDYLTSEGLVLPNDLINEPDSAINRMIKKTKAINQSLGREKTNPNSNYAPEAIDFSMEEITKYRNVLKDMLKSRKYTKGNGLKLTPRGQLGRLQIDPNLLRVGRLKAYIGGSLVLDCPADKSLQDLLTKRLDRRNDYTPQAVETFRHLVKLSGIPLTDRKNNRKVDLLGGPDIKWYNSPDQLVERLTLLIASKQAGNTGVANELSNVIDALESRGCITKSQAAQLHTQV